MTTEPDTMSAEVGGALCRRLGHRGLDAWFCDERGKWGIYPLDEGDFGDPLCWCATVAEIFDLLDLLDGIIETVKAKRRGRP